MGNTKIEWCDKVWNPVTGCRKVSRGCENCYAESIANRFWGDRKFTDVIIHSNRFNQPLSWKKPSRIFVNSMSDLFHDDVSDEIIFSIFKIMKAAHWHTFMVLTKRPKRMCKIVARIRSCFPDRLDHIWLGVSVEDQKTADDRIPLLVITPARYRFVSAEPLLGPVDFKEMWGVGYNQSYPGIRLKFVDQVIVGGESGPKARPMQVEWVRSIRDQCRVANVAFFMKQGSQANWPKYKDFDLFPEDLQIREYPNEG
ncbi:MAG: DUF5131 family protein [Waddliaceae bacterium]